MHSVRTKLLFQIAIFVPMAVGEGEYPRAANYCRTSDNVRLNLANVRAKVILIGHWSDHKKNCHIIHFFAVTKSDYKFTQFAFCNKIYEAL